MKDPKEVELEIISYLTDAEEGKSKENPKLDFKLKWLNLGEKEPLSEFLKDTSAMANTVGLDGYLVIGFDDKANKFQEAHFKDSGLKDQNELTNLIIKNVERNFEIRVWDFNYSDSKDTKHSLSIIHIPPSLDKPHLLKSYLKNGKLDEHITFVRRNSEVRKATKYDFEFMYYDRKNIIPEYELYVSISRFQFNRRDNSYGLDLQCIFSIENVGRRPVHLNSFSIRFDCLDYFNVCPVVFRTPASHHGREVIIKKDEIYSYNEILFKSGSNYIPANNMFDWDIFLEDLNKKKNIKNFNLIGVLKNGREIDLKTELVF